MRKQNNKNMHEIILIPWAAKKSKLCKVKFIFVFNNQYVTKFKNLKNSFTSEDV
jgi:hypothetical protein